MSDHTVPAQGHLLSRPLTPVKAVEPRIVALFAVSLSLLAVCAAPLLPGRWKVASLGVYTAFSWVCHQRPDRTWHVSGYPLAVCIRCLGFYAGAFFGAMARFKFSRRRLLGALAFAALEWLMEFSVWPSAPTLLRFASAAVAGMFLLPLFWAEPKRVRFRMDEMSEVHL